MKKTLSHICTLAALTMMTAATFTACSSDDGNERDNWVPPVEPQYYTMTIQATKGMDTRALSYDGEKINATWATGEKVYVYNNTQNAALDGSLEAKAGGTTVTLGGNLTGTVEIGDELYLGFPGLNEDYTGQNGTLATIATAYDYALAWATVTDVTNGKITAEDNFYGGNTIRFDNQQAIVRFTLLDKADDSPINATSLTIEAKDAFSADKLIQTFDFTASVPTPTYGPITITPSATNVIYAALATDESNASYDYTLTATDENGNTYTYTTSSAKKFEYGKYYEITVKMNRQPRTYNLNQATGDITLKNGDTATGEMENMLSIATGATVTLDNVTINDNLIFCDGGSTTINLVGDNSVSSDEIAIIIGLEDPDPNTLTIQGSGSLTATTTGVNCSAIGGGSDYSHLVIKSGTIEARGGAGAPAIGAWDSDSGNITIEGGTVTATGGEGAPAIGASMRGSCGDITISFPATVTATKGTNAHYSIGSCDTKDGGNCSKVTIYGEVYWDKTKPSYISLSLSQSPLVIKP